MAINFGNWISLMNVFLFMKNHWTKWTILQQTMCDYQRRIWFCHGLKMGETIIVPIESWTFFIQKSFLGILIFRQTHISWLYVIHLYIYIYILDVALQIHMVDFLATTRLLKPNTTVLIYRWFRYMCITIYIYIHTYIYIHMDTWFFLCL